MNPETQNVPASTDRSSETRARILDAALREFSALGMAGARMDQIAAAAGVKRHVHLDIAPRMDVPKGSELSGPATGEPVPLLVEAIRAF